MTFGSPALLWLLLLLPLAVAAYVLFQRRRPRYAVRFTNLNLLANVVPHRPAWRRYLPPALYLLSLAALAIALARPQATIKVPRREGTVMLVMDVSGSMDATDVQPSRLTAAITEANRFLNQLPSGFRVGVVAFSSSAQVLAPPTTDRARVRDALNSLRANGGTAMGDGIERALDFSRPGSGNGQPGQQVTHDRLGNPGQPSTPAASAPGPSPSARRPAGAPPGIPAPARPSQSPGPVAPSTGQPASASTGAPEVVLLLSDGASNAGQVQPAAAAQDAQQLHVPIYTIALGTPDGTLDVAVPGRGLRRIAVPPDPATLQQVARISGGSFFSAPSDRDLHDVYQNLASKIGFENEKQDVTPLFEAGAAVLLLVGGALATLWFHRFP